MAKLYAKYKQLAGARVPFPAIRHKMQLDGLDADEILTGLKVIIKTVLKRSPNKKFNPSVRACMLACEKATTPKVSLIITSPPSPFFAQVRPHLIARGQLNNVVHHQLAFGAASATVEASKWAGDKKKAKFYSKGQAFKKTAAAVAKLATSEAAAAQSADGQDLGLSATASSTAAATSPGAAALAAPTLPMVKAVAPFTCPWCTFSNSGKSGPACEICNKTQAAFDDKERRKAEDEKLKKKISGDAWDCPKW